MVEGDKWLKATGEVRTAARMDNGREELPTPCHPLEKRMSLPGLPYLQRKSFFTLAQAVANPKARGPTMQAQGPALDEYPPCVP